MSKTWLITGASSGFGRAIAQAALIAGDNVAVTSRDPGRLADLIATGGPRCLPLSGNVTSLEDVDLWTKSAITEFGTVDVLVNNAGNGLICSIEQTTVLQQRCLMDMHYHGPLSLIRSVLPEMRTRRSGAIINMGAAATHGNYPGFGAYGAAKAAMECASESLRTELLPLGIQVCVVVPGPFRTGFIENTPRLVDPFYRDTVGKFAGLLERMNGRQPGDPERAAGLIVRHALSGTMPFLLPLGGYVLKTLKERSSALAKCVEDWGDAAKSTDFP